MDACGGDDGAVGGIAESAANGGELGCDFEGDGQNTKGWVFL